MDDDELQAALERDADRIGAALRAAGEPGLTAPVPWCGTWTVRDLVVHLGGVHRWATAATRTPPDGRVAVPESAAPSTVDTLTQWFDQGLAELLAGLRGSARDRPCWTLAPPATVAFWTRRQAQETAVHRWDVEVALGGTTGATMATPIEADLALDGIDEVLHVLLPRQVRLGRAPAAAHPATSCELRAADRTWVVGPGEPVVRVSGTAGDVLLALWGREPVAPLAVEGDAEAWARFSRGAPTP